jgi:hypothetical protein
MSLAGCGGVGRDAVGMLAGSSFRLGCAPILLSK